MSIHIGHVAKPYPQIRLIISNCFEDIGFEIPNTIARPESDPNEFAVTAVVWNLYLNWFSIGRNAEILTVL